MNEYFYIAATRYWNSREKDHSCFRSQIQRSGSEDPGLEGLLKTNSTLDEVTNLTFKRNGSVRVKSRKIS